MQGADKWRDRGTKLLKKLCTDDVAKSLEATIFEHNQQSHKYKTAIRVIYAILARNTELRVLLETGQMSVSTFYQMHPDDTLNAAQKLRRAKVPWATAAVREV